MTAPTKLYFATCRSTGKSYAGITFRTLLERWADHVKDSRLNKFHAAIEQYGADDFELIELFVYPTWEAAETAETSLIAAMDLIASGYNTATGGGTGPLSLETRAKMSASKKGKKRAPFSEKWKANLSAAQRARAENPEYRATLATFRGKKHTAETKDKMAKASTGRRHSDDTRLRMSLKAKARAASPEGRARLLRATHSRLQHQYPSTPEMNYYV